jgi:hypothetical protein
VQGLKNAKKIWDVLKTAHEGDEVTKITESRLEGGGVDRRKLKFTTLNTTTSRG